MTAHIRPHAVRISVAPGMTIAADRFDPPRGAPARPAALLLHGGGQTRHAWKSTASRLAAAGFAALAADQRGHGDSGWAKPPAYTHNDFADDALALADGLAAENGRRPIVIGASLGGIAALVAQTKRPDAFSALALVDITPSVKPGGVAAVQGFMRERAREGFASIEEAGEAVARYLPHRPKPRSLDGLRKNLRERDGRFYWHWDPDFLDGPRGVSAHDAANRLPLAPPDARAAVPTLLVRGRESELVGAAETAAFREDFPHAEIVDISGARHMVAGDRNDVFANTIVDFLARHFPA